MSDFQFKQFSIDQRGAAMKINTDGVLLGALADPVDHSTILDIGTGTGVIALMLAQRFPTSTIDALEIDKNSAETAERNFELSPFSDRLCLYAGSFKAYSEDHPDKKYDLIVSNPPFHLNSLKPGEKEKVVARHSDEDFFSELVAFVSRHLSAWGSFWVILPLKTGELLRELFQSTDIQLANTTTIHSFINSVPHRELLAFDKQGIAENFEKFVIYSGTKEYSSQYRKALKNFFIIFD